MADYTILLIDYEPRSIERLRRPLERAGYRVEVATDGKAGIIKFHSLRPVAVIIEAMLPKRHGFEVCHELKQTPHGMTCPVMIATSVYRGRKYRHQAMYQYSCDAYLEKPIADEDLIDVVKTALKDYAEARDNASAEALEIDTTLLGQEPPLDMAATPEPTEAQPKAAPPRQAAPASNGPDPEAQPDEQDDMEMEILDRLDSLLSDDPSKSSPTSRK